MKKEEKLHSVSLPACTQNREEKEALIVFLLCVHGMRGHYKDHIAYYCAKDHCKIDYMKCPYCKKYKELKIS